MPGVICFLFFICLRTLKLSVFFFFIFFFHIIYCLRLYLCRKRIGRPTGSYASPWPWRRRRTRPRRVPKNKQRASSQSILAIDWFVVFSWFLSLRMYLLILLLIVLSLFRLFSSFFRRALFPFVCFCCCFLLFPLLSSICLFIFLHFLCYINLVLFYMKISRRSVLNAFPFSSLLPNPTDWNILVCINDGKSMTHTVWWPSRRGGGTGGWIQ